MSKLLLIIVFNSFTCYCVCQKKLVELLPKESTKLRKFIPEGWLKIDSTIGDFNEDGVKDYALVIIDSINEKVLGDINRSIVIVEGSKSGFKLSGYCDSAILCLGCGGIYGDPYQGIEFRKNILIVNHYGGSAWRWSVTDKFRFQNNDWYLIGETKNSYWNVKMCDKLGDFAGTDYDDENFITGEFETKKISEDCKLLENKKGKKKIQHLISLNDFKIDN